MGGGAIDSSSAYTARRAQIAARARGPGREPADIAYTASDDATWAAVMGELVPRWERHAASAALRGLEALALDREHVPQLRTVSARLEPLCGFRYEAVAGLVPKETFFGALADRRVLSTQFVRSPRSPDYTPEPDVIHEVIGHAHLLADPGLAELHRLAGAAMLRLDDLASRQFVADVFWFSGEFGVVREATAWKAYGAGLLSSAGELGSFATTARIGPIDVAAMGTIPYDITRFQPRLFGARSLQEVLDVIGGFFATCTDSSIGALRRSARSEVRA